MPGDYAKVVDNQPEALERSARTVSNALADLDLRSWRGGALGVIGMGASTHAAHALVAHGTRIGRRVVNFTAADLFSLPDGGSPADSYLVVSESGRSRETIAAAQRLPAGRRVGLTNAPDAPMKQVVDAIVPMDAGEDSAVYTIGYTATLQAFGLLADAAGWEGAAVGLSQLPEHARRVLDETDASAHEVGRALATARAVDVVGSGVQHATATESALLIREAARKPTAAYETYQYLHGPMEWLDEQGACLIFGAEREVELAQFVASTGAQTVLVTTASDVPESEGLTVFQVPATGPFAQAVLEMLPVQQAVGGLAAAAGLGISGFRYHQDDTKLPA